jgi:hypothetical protein
MHRSTTALATLAAFFFCVPALARNGGLYFELAPGWGIYDTKEVIIEDGDDGEANGRFPIAGFTPQVKLGVNLFGWAGVEADVGAFGWDLDRKERGGSGFAGGTFRVTPLEVLTYVVPDTVEIPTLQGPKTWRDRPFDLGLYVGGGYAIVGEDFAYEGSYVKWGADLKFYVTPNLALGIDFPIRNMLFKPFRYSHYMDGQGFCTDGAQAFGKGGVKVEVSDNRATFAPLELNESELDRNCSQRAPTATFYAPSFTLSGVFDFGI